MSNSEICTEPVASARFRRWMRKYAYYMSFWQLLSSESRRCNKVVRISEFDMKTWWIIFYRVPHFWYTTTYMMASHDERRHCLLVTSCYSCYCCDSCYSYDSFQWTCDGPCSSCSHRSKGKSTNFNVKPEGALSTEHSSSDLRIIQTNATIFSTLQCIPNLTLLCSLVNPWFRWTVFIWFSPL